MNDLSKTMGQGLPVHTTVEAMLFQVLCAAVAGKSTVDVREAVERFIHNDDVWATLAMLHQNMAVIGEAIGEDLPSDAEDLLRRLRDAPS